MLALGVGLTGIVIGLGGGRSTPQRIALIGGGAIVMFLALVAYAAAVVSYGKLRSTEQLGAERSPAPEPAAP